MVFSKTDKLLFVVDKDYYPLIYKYKNNHPELNIKVINDSGLLDKAGYCFKDDPFPYLIKEKHIEYSKAKKFTQIVRYLRNYQGEKELEQQVIDLKDFLTVDEYGLLELNRYQIYLVELDENEGIKSLLNRLNIKYQLIHLEDLNITRFNSLEHAPIVHFSNKFAQFSFIFSDIKKRISENPDIKEKIKILSKDESDTFYIETLGKLFGVDVYSINQVPVISNPVISKAVSWIYKNQSFELIEDNEDINILKGLIEKYHLRELDDFEYAYLNLMEILSSQNLLIPHGDRGIVITSKFVLDPDDIIYVSNFEYGSFYKEYSDNNVYPDSFLFKTGLTASFNKTALDLRKKRNYLAFNQIVLLSRVKQHQSDSIYNSHFLTDELKRKVITNGKVNEINVDGEFSSIMSLLLSAHQYDQRFIYKQINEYRSYDHSYKGVQANDLMVKDVWSVTSLEKFFDCPFKFLMDKLIPLPSDLHNAHKGTFIHSILEDVMHSDFDFDKSFARAKAVYEQKLKDDGEAITPKEEIWLEMYKYWLSQIIPSLRRINEHNQLIENKNDAEVKVSYEIEGYKFYGSIDKIIFTGNDSFKYYTIVDYKTGAETYDDMALAVGKSIQLPLYYYALTSNEKNQKIVEDYAFGGFLIQHPYFKSISAAFVDKGKFSESNLLNKARYTGVYLGDEEYISAFDDTVKLSRGQISGKFLTGKLTFNKVDDDSILLSDPPDGLTRFNVDDIVELSKKTVVRIIKAIINNEFEIAPSSYAISEHVDLSKLRCTYCSHRDICYVNPIEDAKDYYSYIRNELTKKEDNSNG